MPRTSRRTATTGLVWEALAPAVRWPLHSPRRLAALLAVSATVLWLFTALRPADAADPAPSTPPSGVTSSGRTPATAATPPASVTPAATSPAEVAVRFVTVWARPDLPAEAWHAGVTALATAAFGAQLATVLPANVPARRVVGGPVVGSVTELAAAVTVPTDAGLVLVDLAALADVWRVSGVTPAGAPPTRKDGAASSLAATYTPLPVGG